MVSRGLLGSEAAAAPQPKARAGHGQAAEGPPVQLPAPLRGKRPPTEELLLIRRGNDLLLGQGRRVKCFRSPDRYPAFNDGFARTAVKVAAREGLKKPSELEGVAGGGPAASPTLDGPTGSGVGRAGLPCHPHTPSGRRSLCSGLSYHPK